MKRTKKVPVVEAVAAETTLVRVNGMRPAPMVKGGELLPKQRRVALPNNPKAALAEASRVYREARRGQLHVDDAARLVFMAKSCADIHKDHVLKAEVAELKASVERVIAALRAQGAML
jgi:hypothetical protein